MPIKIVAGVPLPSQSARHTVYPWLSMKVGDSFFVAKGGHTVTSAACYASKTYNRVFATRAVTEGGVAGTRVWRVS